MELEWSWSGVGVEFGVGVGVWLELEREWWGSMFDRAGGSNLFLLDLLVSGTSIGDILVLWTSVVLYQATCRPMVN